MNESPHSAETAAATDFAEKLYTEGILSTRQGRRQLETLMAYEPDFSLEWACQQMAFRAALAEEGDLLSAYAAICPRLARDLAQARAAGVTFEEYMAQHPASPAEEAEREEAAAGRKYYDIAATPLVFHQFIRFVVLPINVLFAMLQLVRFHKRRIRFYGSLARTSHIFSAEPCWPAWLLLASFRTGNMRMGPFSALPRSMFCTRSPFSWNFFSMPAPSRAI